MITQFFKVKAGEIPVATIRLNQHMGDKDEYRLDIESAPPDTGCDDDKLPGTAADWREVLTEICDDKLDPLR